MRQFFNDLMSKIEDLLKDARSALSLQYRKYRHRLRLWIYFNVWRDLRRYIDRKFQGDSTLVVDHQMSKRWLGKIKQNKELNKIISKQKKDITQHFKKDGFDLDFGHIKSDILCRYLKVDVDMYIINKLTYRNDLRVVYQYDKAMLVKK